MVHVERLYFAGARIKFACIPIGDLPLLRRGAAYAHHGILLQ